MLWILIAFIIFTLQILTVLILDYRNASKTVAWLLILYLFPIIGYVMYYFLAKEYNQRRKVRHKPSETSGPVKELLNRQTRMADTAEELRNREFAAQPRLFALLKNMKEYPITIRNETSLLSDTAATYHVMLKEIAEAKSSIHLEFYTIRSDNIGWKFHRALLDKAAQGVKIRVIYDGVGSHDLDRNYLKSWHAAGIETYCFLPPFIALFDKRVNYRNHRKLVIVDGRTAFLGGLNIGDEYLGRNPKMGYWRDLFLQLRGDAVYLAQICFLHDWEFVSGRLLQEPDLFPPHELAGRERVQLISSGPDAYGAGIHEMLFGVFAAAKDRIWIATPYFIPDQSLITALANAAGSGVDVRVLIPGIPDTKLVYWATLSYAEELLHTGVKFYSYRKGFLHSKMILADRLLATVGTANMDMRSLFSNFEINAVLYDAHAINQVEEVFMQDLADSVEITEAEMRLKPKAQRAKEVISRLLSPLL